MAIAKSKIVATFEKVSFEQYIYQYKAMLDSMKSESETLYMTKIEELRKVYDSIQLPKRSTAGSAGYDFFCPETYCAGMYPINIPTGIRVKLKPGWMLMLAPRSSYGFKYHCQLDNTIGIIDSDYYNADNEGHIIARLRADESFMINSGDKFMQGIIIPCGYAQEDAVTTVRTGGIGSTGE